MVGVDKIGEIRRAYFEQERPIKEIVRTLSVSRATVRKIIRGHQTEFKYARDVQPTPKLGVWVEALTEILESESKLAKRERRSTQRLFEELRGRGYDGAHDSVHRFVRSWREERARVPAHAYVPMSFAPGEAYQFDWSHETITLQGLPLTVKAAARQSGCTPLRRSDGSKEERRGRRSGGGQWPEVPPVKRVGRPHVHKEDFATATRRQPCQAGSGRERLSRSRASPTVTESTLTVSPLRQTDCPGSAATCFMSGTPRGR